MARRTHTSDLDRALRAAAGIDDADVLGLPQAAIAELVAETVETIAWTYADTHAPVSAPANRSDVLVGAAELGAPPVRGPAAPRRPPAARGRRRAVLATALTLAVVGGTAFALSMASNTPSNRPVNAASPTGSWPTRLHFPGPATAAAVEACIQQLEPHGGKEPDYGFKFGDPAMSDSDQHTFVFTVVANDTSFGTCPSLDGQGEGSIAWQDPDYPRPPGGGVSVGMSGDVWTYDANGKRVESVVFAGFIGSEVTGITIRRADGASVPANLGERAGRWGLWSVWWQGTSHAVSVTVTTQDGHSRTTPIGEVPVFPHPADR